MPKPPVSFPSVVTPLRRGAAAPQALQRTLRFLLEGPLLGVWDLDLATGQLSCSEHLLALFGLPLDSAPTSEELLDAIHPDDRQPLDVALRRTLDEAAGFEIDLRSLWPDGSLHRVNSRGCLSRDPAGRPQRFSGIAFDITARKLAEQALRESEQRLRLIQDLSPDGFSILRPVRDDAGRVIDFSWVYLNHVVAR